MSGINLCSNIHLHYDVKARKVHTIDLLVDNNVDILGDANISGNMQSDTITTTGNATFGGNMQSDTITTTGNATFGGVVAAPQVNATARVSANQIESNVSIQGLQWSGGGLTGCSIQNNGTLRRTMGDTLVMDGTAKQLSNDIEATFIDGSGAGGSLLLGTIGFADYQYKTIMIESYSAPITATSASLALKETGKTITFTGVGQTLSLVYHEDELLWYIVGSRGVMIV